MSKFSFGKNSGRIREELDPDLQKIVDIVIRYFNISLVEGLRGRKLQNEYFEDGLSKVKYPNSKHNIDPSKAVHCIPYPEGYKANEKEFGLMAGYMLMAAHILLDEGEISHELRWGGDWDRDHDTDDQKLHDLAHFEIV